MGLLDGILGQVAGNLDIAALAEKVGLDPAIAEKAVAALGQAHAEPGDTVATAAERTGIDSGIMGQLAGALGGEGALGQLSGLIQGQGGSLLGALDRDGDGNPLNDLAGLAGGLLGKN